jgi:hypothetical protein
MKSLYQFLLLTIGALALAGTAYGQVPSTNYNTGMGTGALGGPLCMNPGSGNTAVGFNALVANTTGGDNKSHRCLPGFPALP